VEVKKGVQDGIQSRVLVEEFLKSISSISATNAAPKLLNEQTVEHKNKAHSRHPKKSCCRESYPLSLIPNEQLTF